MASFRGYVPLMVLSLGWLLASQLDGFSPAIPYIITLMLFLTFLKVRPRDIRFRSSHLLLLLIQVALAGFAYVVALPFSRDAAGAMLLCFLTPSATAGPSIVQALRGDTAYTTSYVLLSHLAFVLLCPFVFFYISQADCSVSIIGEMWAIFYQVARLIVPAIAVAWLIVWLSPRLADKVSSYTQLGYNLWLLSLLLLIAHSTMYLRERSDFALSDLLLMAGLGAITCVMQYAIGHAIAPLLGGEQHALRHSLGQKNTSLSIWIATLFLPPLVGIGITSYIIWQNIIISFVLSRYGKR